MMMKKDLRNGIVNCLNHAATKLMAQNVNSACVWVVYQPEVPKEANKFKKNIGNDSWPEKEETAFQA